MKVLHGKGEIALLFEGTSTNDVRRFSAIFDLPTMSDNFYPITSDICGLFWTPLPTLKLDVIYGCSLSMFIVLSTPLQVLTEHMNGT